LNRAFKDLTPSSILRMATRADKLLFILLIVFAITGFFFAKEMFPSGAFIKISLDNKTVYTLPLDEDRIVTVTGPIGESSIEIKNSKVHIKDAPCPKKLCIHQGWIDRGAIICLPNKVVVSVSGEEQPFRGSEYDAISK